MNKKLAISTLLGLLVGAFMMNAAWQHNSQGEIHADGIIDWSYWILIGLSWFIPVFIVCYLIGLLIFHKPKLTKAKIKEAEQAGDGDAEEAV